MIPVATFDFKIDDLLGSIFNFTEDKVDKFPFSFELIGYGNNAITNMGSVFVVNVYQIVLMLLFGFLAKVSSPAVLKHKDDLYSHMACK